MLVANDGDVRRNDGIIKAPNGWFDSAGGYTALHYASAEGHADMAGFLLDSGADIEALWRSVTPLNQAVYWGRSEAAALLLSRGAETEVNSPSVLYLAVANGALPHGQYFYGWGGTEEMFSDPDKGNYAVLVSLLLSHDAEVNARFQGRSPLDYAAQQDDELISAMLRGAGGICYVETGPLCGDVHVAVGFSSSGLGTVSAEGDGDALSDGDEVRQGATVVFTATPATGHYVSGWSGNCAEAGEVADGLDGAAKFCAVAADSALSVRAEFSEIPSLAGPLCPSGSLSANGMTQAQLDAGLLDAVWESAGETETICEYLRRGANVEAQEITARSHPGTPNHRLNGVDDGGHTRLAGSCPAVAGQ